MSYVQGFVCAVPTANKQAYIDFTTKVAPVFMDLGATRMVETWGDDVPTGEVTDFRRAVNATPDEAVVFSWIVWPDRATYQAAEAMIDSDPRLQAMGEAPFDMKRMIYAGFMPIFDTDKI